MPDEIANEFDRSEAAVRGRAWQHGIGLSPGSDAAVERPVRHFTGCASACFVAASQGAGRMTRMGRAVAAI
uniref:Uncharacterized protein n=1 Tax=Bradyrhizobium amphicarpaeae TaxID=1404768 RepID=A0A2U8PXM3_9BRAD|nr:hypothetical protein CIT40_22730 [Bradyrhizobium amphicarpaeae]